MVDVQDVQRGDHACLVYGSVGEHAAAAAAYIADGLALGERCVYVAGDAGVTDVVAALEERGVDVPAQVTLGALQLARAHDVYASAPADADAMLTFLEGRLRSAIEEGYQGLRATGDMSSAFGDSASHDTFLRYEEQLNSGIAATGRLTKLCQYDRERLTDEVVQRLAASHALVVS